MPKKPKANLRSVPRILFRDIERDALDLRMDIAAYYGSADEEQRKKLDEALTGLRINLTDIALGQFDPAKDGLFDDQH